MPVPLEIKVINPKSRSETIQLLYHDACSLVTKLKELLPHIDSYNSMSLPSEDMLEEVEDACYEVGTLISAHKSAIASKTN